MKLLIVLLASIALALSSARADLLLQPTDRVALCGDELPDAYAGIYLEEYLMVAEPSLRSLDIETFGGMGGDPAAIRAKLDSTILPFKPAVVVLSCSWPADPALQEKNLTALIEALKKAGVRLIVVGSPPAVAAADFQNNQGSADSQNQTRAATAGIDQRVAAKEGVVYAGVFDAVKDSLARAKALEGEAYVKQAAYSEAFQLAVAGAFLKAFGCDGDIGSVTVDYAANTGEADQGQKISAIKDHGFTIQTRRYPFYFAGHGVGAGDPTPWPALKFVSFENDLNRYILRVKNLPTAQTKIYFGDTTNADFSSADLAKGVNLMAEMPAWNPFANAGGPVDNAIGSQMQVERILHTTAPQSQPGPQADAKHEAAMQLVHRRIPASLGVKVVIQPLGIPEKWPPGPIPVVLDTDLDSDVDDVGALAILDNAMDQGKVNLLAVLHDTANVNQSSCATIKAINDWYFHPNIPIGQYLGEHPAAPMTSKVAPAPAGPGAYHDPLNLAPCPYSLQVRQRFEPNFPDDNKMPAGVDVYRKALASAPDGSVVICCVGWLQNVQDLMLSEPDSVSPLSGMDLIKKKVRQLIIMFNTQPADLYTLSHWPKPILWTTDVGNAISTGQTLIGAPENNPVRMCYDLFGVLHGGRQSWDLTAAWLAANGPSYMFDVIPGRPPFIHDIIHDEATDHPKEAVVTVKLPYDQDTRIIGEELAQAPKK